MTSFAKKKNASCSAQKHFTFDNRAAWSSRCCARERVNGAREQLELARRARHRVASPSLPSRSCARRASDREPGSSDRDALLVSSCLYYARRARVRGRCCSASLPSSNEHDSCGLGRARKVLDFNQGALVSVTLHELARSLIAAPPPSRCAHAHAQAQARLVHHDRARAPVSQSSTHCLRHGPPALGRAVLIERTPLCTGTGTGIADAMHTAQY